MTGIAHLAPTVGRSVFGDNATGYRRAQPGCPVALDAARWQQRLTDAGFEAIEDRVLRREWTLNPRRGARALRDIFAAAGVAALVKTVCEFRRQ